MIEPLALVLYEKLLPGSQLVNRLQDLSYRVQTLNDPGKLVTCAEQAKPMVVLADLDKDGQEVCAAIASLKQHGPTNHLPVIGFSNAKAPDLQTEALAAGVTLVVSDAAVLEHLEQCLERALQIE